MLIRYKASYEKIAMGLLSFMPQEKELKQLLKTMKQYEENDDWKLYLWREGDDIIGIAGIYYCDDQNAELTHICVNPSHRHLGIGRKIVQSLTKFVDDVRIIPNEQTKGFFDRCLNVVGNESL
jgi:riboflavin biosynthesis RibT protein